MYILQFQFQYPLFQVYYRFLKSLLVGKRPYLVILSTITLLVISITTFGSSISSQRTSIEFFPDEDPRQIMVYIQYPEGTDISKTNEISMIFGVVPMELVEWSTGPIKISCECCRNMECWLPCLGTLYHVSDSFGVLLVAICSYLC